LSASSSIQDAAASLPDAFNADPEIFGCRGQLMPAAIIGFKISIDGTNAIHASFAVLVVKVASSSLMCTALHLDSIIILSFLWCGTASNDLF